MRILILTPTSFPRITGNAVTTERWRRSLGALGHDVRVLATRGLPAEELAREVERFSPEVLHVHHAGAGAFLTTPAACACQEVRLVVSPAGTDIYSDAADSGRRAAVSAVLGKAAAIVVQSEETVGAVRAAFPEVGGRLVLVPRAFSWLGTEAFDLRAAAGAGREEVVFFLPAGIRPVKRNLECLLGMEEIWGARPHVRCAFAGPILDPEYGTRFLAEVERCRGFATWLGPLAPGVMRAAYGGADVVLNTSAAEGLPNALLEAAAAHKPILASDIPGNRWPVLGTGEQRPCGLLFRADDRADFERQALLLVDQAGFRRELAAAARERSGTWPSPETEALSLAEVYRRVVQPASSATV